MKQLLQQCVGFEWNKGTAEKNWVLHRVSRTECEQSFFNEPLVVADDEKYFQDEKRYYLLGQTDLGRLLFIVFTIRENLIRVISSRDQHKKERSIYHDL